eukprot:1716632-Pyramimonas_sp.AAC.2
MFSLTSTLLCCEHTKNCVRLLGSRSRRERVDEQLLISNLEGFHHKISELLIVCPDEITPQTRPVQDRSVSSSAKLNVLETKSVLHSRHILKSQPMASKSTT